MTSHTRKKGGHRGGHGYFVATSEMPPRLIRWECTGPSWFSSIEKITRDLCIGCRSDRSVDRSIHRIDWGGECHSGAERLEISDGNSSGTRHDSWWSWFCRFFRVNCSILNQNSIVFWTSVRFFRRGFHDFSDGMMLGRNRCPNEEISLIFCEKKLHTPMI